MTKSSVFPHLRRFNLGRVRVLQASSFDDLADGDAAAQRGNSEAQHVYGAGALADHVDAGGNRHEKHDQ